MLSSEKCFKMTSVTQHQPIMDHPQFNSFWYICVSLSSIYHI